MSAELLARALLLAFGACNTLFLAVDGIAVGWLSASDPAAADAVWATPLVGILANATGATWAAALLSQAAANYPTPNGRAQLVGLGFTWLSFVASAALPEAAVVSRAFAIGLGAWSVYQHGTASLPWAVLIFAAVLRQHVGGEAALGLILVAVAVAFRERSGLAAESRP